MSTHMLQAEPEFPKEKTQLPRWSFANFASFVFIIAVFISAWEIIARHAFDAPTIWVHESVIALVALGYLAGGLFVHFNDKHIRISLLYDNCTGISHNYLRIFVTAASALFFGLSAYAAYKGAFNAWFTPHGVFRAEGTGSAWNPPTPGILKSALALTLAVMGGFSVFQLFKALKDKLQSNTEKSARGYQLLPILVIAFNIFLAGCLFIYGADLGLGLATLLIVLLMLGLSVAGLPLAMTTGLVALLVTLSWFSLDATPIVTSRIYSFINEYILVAVPMFVLMATLLDRSGIAKDLYACLQSLTKNIAGGLAIQTLLAALFLAAVSGIIGGEIVLLGLIALPQMLKHGYSKHIAIGTVCAGGSLGTMIPPSIVLIIYGLTANVSISDLFLATIVPGTILAVMYMIYIYCQCRWNPKHKVGEQNDNAERQQLSNSEIFYGIAGPIAIMLSVLGTIYGGYASITEAACLGVTGTFLLTWMRKRLTLQVLKESLLQTLESCGMIIWVGIGAAILVGVYNVIGGNLFIKELILGLDTSPILIVICMMAILLLLGLFMDWIGIALLTMPIFVPIIIALDMNPVWFGILFAVNMQVSYLSPPFGPAVFYLKSVAPKEISLSDIYKSVWPFILIQIALLFLLLLFPDIALWLPETIN